MWDDLAEIVLPPLKKIVMCDGGRGSGDPKICSYLSEIITGESFIIREVRPQAFALTAEARGVYVSFKILSSELRSGIWLVTVQEEDLASGRT